MARMTVEIRDMAYWKLEELSKLINEDMADILWNLIYDCMDDYYADDIRDAEKNKEEVPEQRVLFR